MTLPPLLKGQRAKLAPMTEADDAMNASWHEDPDYVRLSDTRPLFGHPVSAFKKEREDMQKAHDTFMFGIRRLEDDAYIGFCELAGIQWTHRVGWLGISLGRPYWNQGYGAEAMQLLLDFGFWELNLYRIQLTVFEYNARAIALYEKLGFTKEGTHREFMQRGGVRYDMHLYGMLTHEWRSVPDSELAD